MAAGILFVPGIILKGVGTGAALAAARDNGGFGIPGPLVLFSVSILYNPLFATSAGLYGSARAKSGRVAAWDTSIGGKARRTVRPGLGWGLFGGGIGLWAISRLPAFMGGCSELCRVRLMESGYYIALPMTYTGLHIGAFGSAYKKNLSRYDMMKTWSVAPMGGQHTLGLQLSGHF